jgi:transposase
VRELRNLIRAVADDKDHTILNPIQARLKRACKLHRDHDTEKIRQLAREILNDWAAIVAFVGNHALPPTNNKAERALRIAVIARRLSFGTRTEEGSAAYAAALSVVETCRRRQSDPWSYIADTIARARCGISHQPIPAAA